MVSLGVRPSKRPVHRLCRSRSPVAVRMGLAALTLLALGVVGPLASHGQAAPAGHWSLLRTERSEYKVPPKGTPGYPNYVVLWSGSEGNVKATQEGIIDPARREKQTLAAQFSWQKPPRTLTPGTNLQMTLIVSILFNSHPGKGLSWGGQGDITFGNALRLRDKDGKYIVGFGNFGTSVRSLIFTTDGTARLVGQAKVPDSTWRETREVDGQKLLDLRVNMVFNNQPCSYGSVYVWRDGPPPPTTPRPVTPPTTLPRPAPGLAADISGTWRHGGGSATWTFTPQGGGRYVAVEKGLGNARGTAVVIGNKVTLDCVTQDGQQTVRSEMTIAADGRAATGTVTNRTGPPTPRPDTWIRVSGGPTPGGPTPVARMTLRAESRKAKTGETVTVPVWLLKGAGLIDLNVNLEYDATVVQAVGNVVRGNLLEGADFEANTARPGVVRIGLVPRTGGIVGANGTIAQVAFKAVGRPGSRTALRLVTRKASVSGGAPADIATIDGEIQIVDEGGFLPGDVNGDGKVGMDDVLMALKISVELLPQNLRADMDKDGQVTAADARVIREKVLGIKG